MENYNQQLEQENKPVKEKNIYSLNLDRTRIAILSLIVLAIVGLTFVIGTKFSGKDEESSAPQNLAMIDSPINDPVNTDSPLTEQSGQVAETTMPTVADPLFDNAQPSLSENNKAEEKPSVVTNRTEVHHTKPKTERKEKSFAKVQSKESPKSLAKRKEKSSIKPAFAKAGERIFISNKTVKKGSFSVQVASFDSMAKAKNEVLFLKTLKFDGYIDKTEINGNTFFRVRIGPVSTKAEAADLLDKIVLEPRYSESYLVKDI